MYVKNFESGNLAFSAFFKHVSKFGVKALAPDPEPYPDPDLYPDQAPETRI